MRVCAPRNRRWIHIKHDTLCEIHTLTSVHLHVQCICIMLYLYTYLFFRTMEHRESLQALFQDGKSKGRILIVYVREWFRASLPFAKTAKVCLVSDFFSKPTHV